MQCGNIKIYSAKFPHPFTWAINCIPGAQVLYSTCTRPALVPDPFFLRCKGLKLQTSAVIQCGGCPRTPKCFCW